MLASVIVNEVGTMLNDMEPGNEHVRWPVPELLTYLTEAIAAIAQAKPQTFVTIATLNLAPGSVQQLPPQYAKLVDISFNLNADGSEGPNITPSVNALMAAFGKPQCAFATPGMIQSFEPLPGSDRFFMVNPPIPAGLTHTPMVNALVMLTPQVVSSTNQPLIFPSSDPQLYQGALADWVLYRCYAKDQESPSSAERAKTHLLAFQMYLGIGAMPQPQQRRPAQAKAA